MNIALGRVGQFVSTPDVTAGVKDLTTLIQEQITMGKTVVSRIDDPLKKQQMNELIEDLELLAPQLLIAGKEVLAQPKGIIFEYNVVQM